MKQATLWLMKRPHLVLIVAMLYVVSLVLGALDAAFGLSRRRET